MTPIQEMVQQWLEQGALPRPPATAEDVAAFELRHLVSLPADFREYLRLANGTESCDGEFFGFASIQDIKPVVETWGAADAGQDHYDGCFSFADWGIHCWDYAIQLDASSPHFGAVFRVETAEHGSDPIAASFLEWVETYLRDPDQIQPGRRE